MIEVYGDVNSGNCYKVKLVCELLQVKYKWIEVDILKGDTKTDQFVSMNPNGKIPFVRFSDGFCLSESNSIINYIANSSKFYPSDPKAQALIQQWQFFEQYSHEPFIAVARFINKYLGMPESRLQEYKDKQAGGNKALTVMEKCLQSSAFLTGDTITTADISLYAYTHVADEGGFDLSQFPNILNWLKRIENNEHYVAIG